jgi:uncharacterized protein YjbI with pentapeptide repeats
MPLTKAQLISRWKLPPGKKAVRAITEALRTGTSTAELNSLVRELPGTEEVAPAADLRGIALPELIAMQPANLSGARFDHAKLNWNFGGSVLRGAVFDGAEGRNVDFGGSDLTGGSFDHANLPGAVFFGARLVDARLPGIKMRSGQLKGADCQSANFHGADLRLVWAAEADFRNANLTEANLIGASLGQIRWDERTQCAGARLSPEGTPADFAAVAIAQGATLLSEKPEWELGLLDATRVLLAAEPNRTVVDPLLRRFDELRPQLERNPEFAWGEVLARDLTSEQRGLVQQAIRKAASNVGALLG